MITHMHSSYMYEQRYRRVFRARKVSGLSRNGPGARFWPVSRKPLTHFSKCTITELYNSNFLNNIIGSLHTRSFRRIHFSVFRHRWTKNDFTGRKVSGPFEKRAPGREHCVVSFGKALFCPPGIVLRILLSLFGRAFCIKISAIEHFSVFT